VDNLDTKLQGYLKLSFIMEEVDNLLDAKFWVTLRIFLMTDVDNFL
jgi:hypothetical protein